MAENQSFDITTGCDLQEVDNAINQANKELQQRYDFKNTFFSLKFLREQKKLELSAADAFKLEALWDVLVAKLVRRGVPVKNLQRQAVIPSSGQSVRQEVILQQAISTEIAKKIAKFVKEQKRKKVQAAILNEQVRISGPSRDDLQQVMQVLRGEDFGIELLFGNYR